MDWLLFHLTGDVFTHYWYAVQCKLYGFITNKKAEWVVASAVLRSNDIPDHLVKLFPGSQDVAQVISVNHYPDVYTILAPGEEYAQCNCSWTDQGNICKHAVKVYKMIHPKVDDGTIIRRRGTLHGTCATGVDTTDLDSFRTGNLTIVPSKGNGRAGTSVATEDTIQVLRDIHCDIEALAAQREDTLRHALYHARSSRVKVLNFVASQDGKITHPLSQAIMKENEGDNSLKRRKGFLER
jgi:hypothetical protein